MKKSSEEKPEKKFSPDHITKTSSNYKQSEDALSVKDFAIQSSISSIAFADMKGNVTYANNSFIKHWGYSGEEEVIGKHISKFAVSKKQIKNIISSLFAGKGYVGEGYALRKDGSTFTAQLSANLVTASDGKPICMMASFIDISERINAEKALIESENKYRQLFNNMTVGFGLHEMIYDNKGLAVDYRFLEVNPAFEKLTGLKASVIVGKTVKTVLPDTEQYWIDNYARVFQNEGNVIFENYSKELKKWYEARAFKVAKNKFAAIFSDITEQKQSFIRLQKILDTTTKAVSSIVEVKDPYTAGHQERVAKLSVAIAKELKLDKKIISAINTAALLHDLGKIAIPPSILSKPSKLTDIEIGFIKTHPRIGSDVLKNVDYDYPIAKIVLQHHERINGSGYPDGIRDKDIMFESKIIAVADTVEAMSSHRPYRPAVGINEALKEIENNKGILYDTDAVNVCLKLFKSKKFEF